MKLLLTSGGLSNQSIVDALFDLVGKKSENTSLVFIPTASNVEKGDKDWLIDDLINLKILQIIYEEDLDRAKDMAGLNYVDFYFLPHLNSQYFPKLREENIREAVKGMAEKIYAMDDQSALKVVDKQVDIISEGKYLVFN